MLLIKQAKKQGLAHEALRFYKQLYAIERKAKDNAMTPEQRYELRQQESKPLLEKFKAWMEEVYPNGTNLTDNTYAAC